MAARGERFEPVTDVLQGKSKPETFPFDPAASVFTGTLQRIERGIIILGVVAGVILAVTGRLPAAFGLLAGAAVAYVNFRWLKSWYPLWEW